MNQNFNEMECPKCNGNAHKNGFEKGIQKYRCTECNYNFTDAQVGKEPPKPKIKIGMTLNEFRDKHDIEHIVTKTLTKLRADTIYEKNDIVKLAALNYSAPGLSTVLESKTSYYGKAGSKIYYSHPDTIRELKEQAKLM